MTQEPQTAWVLKLSRPDHRQDNPDSDLRASTELGKYWMYRAHLQTGLTESGPERAVEQLKTVTLRLRELCQEATS